MAAIGVNGVFETQGMKLKDEASRKAAAHVSQALGMDLEELAEEYEVFHINKGYTSNVVTSSLLEKFLEHLQGQRSKAKSNKVNNKKATGGSAWHTYTKYDLDDVTTVAPLNAFGRVEAKRSMQKQKTEEFSIRSTLPKAKRPAEVQELQPNKKSTFAQRQRSGTEFASVSLSQRQNQVEAGAPAANTNTNSSSSYKKALDKEHGIDSLIKGPPQNVRFMFDTLESKAKLVDERVQRLASVLENEYGIIASNSVYNISNEPVVVVGRVCSDSVEGRINEASILIEGSTVHSNGMRVRIDTSKLGSVSLFPGQVIAVEGINPSGHCITALSILTGIPKPLRKSEEGEDGKKERKVVVAAGPFTTVNDLSFEPLKAVVEMACRDKPDVLVLCGPFVDRDHPIIRKGMVDIEFEELFKICCESFQKLPKETKAVLIPSVRDVHHDPVYPQPAFKTSGLEGGVKEKIVCASNPAMVSCKGLTIATTSHDILKHLSGTELFRSSSSGGSSCDRMSRLASHVLQQRMFYPLYPPALGSCLDSKLSLENNSMFLPLTPEVLVLPSDLNPFAKEVKLAPSMYTREGHKSVFADKVVDDAEGLASSSCLCINPGRLAKGNTGGTFATLQMNKGKLEKATITRI
jgi:DNA polymerase alpha subunit B